MSWLELPWINTAEVCRMADIDPSNINKKLSGQQRFSPAQLAQLDALQRKLAIDIQRAKKVVNKTKNVQTKETL